MQRISLNLHYFEIESVDQLDEADRMLVEMSRQMTENAYAPYSDFYVGAAALLANGDIVKGSNQENAAYPSGLCAERVAIFSASANYPGVAVKTIAISARAGHPIPSKPVSPCGACRQVLLEYEVKQNEPIRLLLSAPSGKVYLIEKVRDLLPLSFTAEELGKL